MSETETAMITKCLSLLRHCRKKKERMKGHCKILLIKVK